jgi:hypothetical protein
MSKKNVSFDITFTGGAGDIEITAIDGSSDQSFSSDGSFNANQSTGDQDIIVGGAAPAGGSISIDISSDGKKLAHKDFKDGQFNAVAIDYEVPVDQTDNIAFAAKVTKSKQTKKASKK